MSFSESKIIDRLLSVIEQDIVPKTREGVKVGNKLFGAAILKKEDLSTLVSSTNTETENPLWHGEVHTMKKLYELPREQRPNPRDCIFLATHEPCSLCLSAITWGGYDNFYYLFSFEDSRDSFNIPHDLRILKEVFKVENGDYFHDNYYWKSHDLVKLVDGYQGELKRSFLDRIENLKAVYAEMSDVYQSSKGDADIPLD